MKKLVVICCIMLFILPIAIFGDEDIETEIDSKVELTLALGSVTSGDMQLSGNSEIHMDNSYTGSVKLAYFLNRLTAIEFGFTARLDSAFYVEDIAADTGNPDDYLIEDFVNYHLNMGLQYNFGDLQHVPYLTFGLGLTSLEYSELFNVPSGRDRFSIYFAFGYKYYLSESLGTKIEFGFYAFDHENLEQDNSFYMNWLLTAGLIFKL